MTVIRTANKEKMKSVVVNQRVTVFVVVPHRLPPHSAAYNPIGCVMETTIVPTATTRSIVVRPTHSLTNLLL